MSKLFFEFWSFNDPNTVWVIIGCVLLGLSAGVIGSFAFLRKQSLAGDALAHAALPGVTSAFLLFHSREPEVLYLGASISCLISFLVIQYLVKHTKIKMDSALAIVLSTFFALGIFQLAQIQKLPLASQAGLDKMLFGQAASLVRDDVVVLSVVSLLNTLLVFAFYKKLKLITFDRGFAKAVGVPIMFYDALFAVLLVFSIVTGLQLVGVVLMAALILTPPAAARFWTEKLSLMLVLAGTFGAVSALLAANISYIAPRMPTGPWMIVVISTIFLISLLIAPQRGVFPRLWRRRKLARRIVDENVLRTFYKLGESERDYFLTLEPKTVLRFRNITEQELEAALSRLKKCALIEQAEGCFRLSADGLKRAKELTRFHRLWELYLTEKIDIAPDHAHADAEEIEHILTEELGERLVLELESPREDPHGKVIPPG